MCIQPISVAWELCAALQHKILSFVSVTFDGFYVFFPIQIYLAGITSKLMSDIESFIDGSLCFI